MKMTLNEIKQKYGSYFEIATAKDLYCDMVKEEQNYAKLKQLAYTDYVNTVKQNINYFDYLMFIPSAKDYFFANQDEKTDRKSAEFKENRKIFKMLENKMSEWFETLVKIVSFCSGGYSGYYEEVIFTAGSKRKFSFTIPVADKITTENFNYAFEGKLAFGEYMPDNFTHEIIETSYAFEEILEKFKKEMKTNE